MFSEERQQKIAEMLKQKLSLKVNELATFFNVSESTIRRDLRDMEEVGLLSRTHGGAVSFSVTNFEPTFKEKEDINLDEKTCIAKRAAYIIKDGDTIVLDSGTTTLEIAKNITAKNISVITNSIDIALIISHKEDVNLFITGGNMRLTTRAMVGNITEWNLKNFRVDKAFIGANGISIEDGITTTDLTEAQTKKAMMSIAKNVIIVADSSKFNKVCLSVICSIREVTTIITTSDLDNEIIKDYESIGIEVMVSK